MFQTFDLLRTANVTAVVVELDERLTPPGLALELHLVINGSRKVAFWLFEDGRLAKVEAVGEA